MRPKAARQELSDIISAVDPVRTFDLKQHTLFILVTFVLAASVASADTKGPYILTVDYIRGLEPGAEWDPSADDVFVQVRGYLRDSGNMYLYPTRDQALLDDFLAGVIVSDEGEGDLRRNCSEGFVELVARLSWMDTERRPSLIPTRAKKLTLREKGRAEEQVCWEADLVTDR